MQPRFENKAIAAPDENKVDVQRTWRKYGWRPKAEQAASEQEPVTTIQDKPRKQSK